MDEMNDSFIALNNLNYNELDENLSMLAQNQNLKRLDLSRDSNGDKSKNLHILPRDLSWLETLEELNLNGNKFQDIYKVIDCLTTIPNLLSLYINLDEEEQVDYIMKHLPRLEKLNGLEVDRDEGEEEEEESEEDLPMQSAPNPSHPQNHNNHIEFYNGEGMENFDTEEENTAFMKDAYGSLSPHTHVEEKENRKTRVEDQLEKKLISNRQPNPPRETQLSSDIQLDELEGIAICYDTIREIHKKRNPERDQELARDFDQHLQRVMKNLSQTVQNANAPQSIKTINGLKAKYDLFDIWLLKLNELVTADNPETGQILSDIHGGIHNIISSYYDFYHEPTVENSSNKLQSENQKLTKIVQNMELEIKRITDQKNQMKIRLEEEKMDLHDQIENLENENKKYLETIIKHSKGEMSGVRMSKAPDSAGKPPMQFSDNSANRAFHKSPPKIPKTKEFTYSKFGSGKSNRASGGGSARRSAKGNNLGGSIGQTQVRNLSLKQLTDLITDIYNQKVKYDKKCEENQLPRETMEQYMYTYLNQRYGLKNLIIEWAASIINGIKKYSKDDHSVSLFGKILRNEWDEEFRFIQMHVQDTLNNLLKAVLREKHPHKSEQGINAVYEQVQNGFIDDNSWARIIERMYDEQDWFILEEKFRDIIQNRQNEKFLSDSSSRQSKRKLTREERLALVSQKDSDKLLYSEFLKAVLDFQLKEHEKFLYKFIVAFKQVDTDNNGVVNEDEFSELVKRMKIWDDEEQDISYFLQVVDPYNNNEITFSEIVHLFSAHMVSAGDSDNPEKTIPILEKFAKEG